MLPLFLKPRPAFLVIMFCLLGQAASCLQLCGAIPKAAVISPAEACRSGGGHSYSPVLSADGRWLAFASQANNLVTNDDVRLHQDLFLRDLSNRCTFLLSINTNGAGGGTAWSANPSLSSNGQWIAFESAASNLVPGDENGTVDVFVRDQAAQTTRLVSVSATGARSGNGRSGSPLMTADGRWVVFESAASDLTGQMLPTNQVQVYARNLQTDTTVLVSVNREGTGPGDAPAACPAISIDARWVAFISTSTNLAAGAELARAEAYVRDRDGGMTTWASSNVAGCLGSMTNGYDCLNLVMSQDGGKLAFLVGERGATNAVAWLLIHDRASGLTACVASNVAKDARLDLDASGGRLAYESGTNVCVWDDRRQTNLLVNIGYDGIKPGNGAARTPVLSANGEGIVFLSSATDLVTSNGPGDATLFQLFLRDLESGTTRLINGHRDQTMSTFSLELTLPAVSVDSRLVAFESEDAQLVLKDDNFAADVFLWARETGAVGLVSACQADLPNPGGTGGQKVADTCLSADGRFVLTLSLDSYLSAADTNRIQDIYIADLLAGTNIYLPVPPSLFVIPLPKFRNEWPQTLGTALSGDGNTAASRISYTSSTGLSQQITMYSRQGAQIGSLNLGTDVQPKFAFTPDGQWLAFCSKGNQIQPGMVNYSASYASLANIGLRQVTANTNVLISHCATNSLQTGNGHSTDPFFSPDGRWLLFYSQALDLVTNAPTTVGLGLFAYDLQAKEAQCIYWTSNLTGAVFSANSRYLAFSGGSPASIYRYDFGATNPTAGFVISYASNPSVSTNGQLFAFLRSSASGIADVWITDLATHTRERVSVGLDGISGGTQASSAPQISPDGRFVVFASLADNLVPGDDNGRMDIFLRDRLLGLTYLLSANPKTGKAGNGSSTSPVLSADGSTVVFSSFANNLIEGDYNDKQNVFVVKLTSGDSDGDSLDDAWEMAHFGNLDRDGAGDFDGDGLTDRQEYRAGTDPTNRGSVLRALVQAPVGGQSTTLQWPAAKGTQYKVQFKRNVAEAEWTDLETTVLINGATASAMDAEAGLDAARFYRIVILP